MSDFREILSFLDILSSDKTIILKAIDSDFSDFEDALQNFSAEQYGKINAIVTRNTKNYKKSKINVLTPSRFLQNYNCLVLKIVDYLLG